jgi:hypothetical protein
MAPFPNARGFTGYVDRKLQKRSFASLKSGSMSASLFGLRSTSGLSPSCASKRTSADASEFMDSRPGLPRLLALRRQPNLLKRINVNCPTGQILFPVTMPNDVV